MSNTCFAVGEEDRRADRIKELNSFDSSGRTPLMVTKRRFFDAVIARTSYYAIMLSTE